MRDESLNVSRIEVKLDSARSGRHKTLYANGRMQVRVLVFIHGVDNDGDGASLYGHPALQSLRLIAYNGGRPLDGEWTAAVQENRYAHEVSGGAPRVTQIPQMSDNRISDDADPVQIFEFWVSASRPGIMEVAAEIVINGVVLRSNGVGFDSSITLEAIPPKEYPLNSFSLNKHNDAQQRAQFDSVQIYHIGLHAEGRQIHLLDWYSSEVKLHAYDSEDAVRVYLSGNIRGTEDGRRNMYGYMAPIYGQVARVRSPLGPMTVPINEVPGKLTLFKYISADAQDGRENTSAFEFAVIDEFGSEHRLSLDGDKELRTFILGQSKRSMKRLS